MTRSQFYRPQMWELESRLQPGSVFTGVLDTSLLAGSLGVLGQSLLAPLNVTDDASPAGALDAPVHVAQPLETGIPEVFPPAPQLVSVATHGLPVQIADLDDTLARTVQAVPGKAPVGGLTARPLNDGGHIFGTACEEGGNVVVNGDMELNSDWFQIGDPFAGFVNGGDLTPGRHIRMGAVDTPGLVYQDVTTEVDVVYTIRFSMRVDPDGPASFVVMWNDTEVADLTSTEASETYTRYEFVASVTGTGLDRFGFREQHDPAYWHVDDACVTPFVE